MSNFQIFILLVSICWTTQLYGQPDLSDKELYAIRNKRASQVDFYRSMNSYRLPSTLNSITNKRWHQNGYEKKKFILDGDLNIPISIKLPEVGKYLQTLLVIPRFQFRIFSNDDQFPYGIGDTSNPVRTPSAMPGAAYFMTHERLWDDSHSANYNRKWNWYWGVYAYHHSNGQDGNELDTTNAGVVRVNLYNGNFGEQVVIEPTIGGRYLFNFKHRNLDPKDADIGEVIKEKSGAAKILQWQLSYEFRPNDWTNSTFDRFNIYGKRRLRSMISFSYLKQVQELLFDGSGYALVSEESLYERWRFTLRMGFITDRNYNVGNINALESVGRFDLSKRLNTELFLNFIPEWSKNFGFYGSFGYIASDEYNIYFQDRYWSAEIGVSFAFYDQPAWQEIDLIEYGIE